MEWMFGVYECHRCEKDYTVNDEWAECTPTFCHSCWRFLKLMLRLAPDHPETRH
jgi:hypothetical protein